jgi:hypothetical protein
MAMQALGRALGLGHARKALCAAALQGRALSTSGAVLQAEPQPEMSPIDGEPRWLRELGAVRTDWT